MRPSALLLPLLVLTIPLGIMTGCGGGSSHDCSDTLTDGTLDNSVYYGSYAVTFTPNDGDAANTINANLVVYDGGIKHGNIKGTVADAGSTGGTTPVSFDSVVAKGKCLGGKTYVRVKFQRSVSTRQEEIDVTSDTLGSLDGASVAGDLTTSAGTFSGTLTFTPATVSQ